MKKLILAISITSLFVLSIQGQKAQTNYSNSNKSDVSKIPLDPSVKIGKLSNGLTYYIKQNSKPENKVELRLVVKVGSVLEDDDQRGLAHFMEHMNFNGTKHFKKNDLVDYLQSIGVKFGSHLNAYTNFNETVYILPIPSDNEEKLEKGFQILEDWAHAALLTDKDINEERGVVLEEYRLSRDANSRMLEKYLPLLMYKSKYAKRLPIGTEESIKNFKHESLRRFYKDWYRPDLMAVIAVGDKDVATLERKIKNHFGKISPPTNLRKRPQISVKNHQETFIAIESDKEAPFSDVEICYKDRGISPKLITLTDYRKSLVDRIFTQLLNNRLQELINSDESPFSFAFSYHGNTIAKNKAAFRSIAATSPEGQLKGLTALIDENERIKRYGFQQTEFERAKKNLITQNEKAYKERNKKESRDIARSFLHNYLNESPIPSAEWSYRKHLELIPTIELNEVNNIIKEYLHDDNRVVIIKGSKKTVTENQVRKLLNEVKTKKLEPYKDKVVAASLITKPIIPGAIVSTKNNEALGTTTWRLSNGAEVIFKKTDFKNDEILFESFSFGGKSLYSNKDLIATNHANTGLTSAGVNGFSKNDLSKMMTGKTVYVAPYIRNLSEGLSGMCAPKDTEELFQMIHLYFTSLNKDHKAYNSFIDREKGFLGNLTRSPDFYFNEEMNKFLHQKNPRFIGSPTKESYDNADYDLAYKKYQERFADAGDFNFYFVGNIDEEKLKAFSKKYLASLPSKNSNEKFKVYDYRPLSGIHSKTVNKGKDPKSKVKIIYQGNTKYNSKESLAFKLLGNVINIKLIEKLREKEAGVYYSSTEGRITKIPYGWYKLVISFPCGPENVEKLKNITLTHITNIIKKGPTAEDLMKAQKGMINDHKEDLKKNRFWLSTLKNMDYMNNDKSDPFTFEDRVSSLTVKDLQKVAKKYLANGYILGVLNPEK